MIEMTHAERAALASKMATLSGMSASDSALVVDLAIRAADNAWQSVAITAATAAEDIVASQVVLLATQLLGFSCSDFLKKMIAEGDVVCAGPIGDEA
jgi:hypothetical protein